jgi:hypothetical protein
MISLLWVIYAYCTICVDFFRLSSIIQIMLHIHNIESMSGEDIGMVDDNGFVFDVRGKKAGRVTSDGSVYDAVGNKCGRLMREGKVFDDKVRHVGTVQEDGYVYDVDQHKVGKVKPPHREFAGAALLLLFR